MSLLGGGSEYAFPKGNLLRGERAFKELAKALADEDLKPYESSKEFREKFAFR